MLREKEKKKEEKEKEKEKEVCFGFTNPPRAASGFHTGKGRRLRVAERKKGLGRSNI